MTAAARRRRYLGWWTLGLLLMLSAAVPAAYKLRPHWQRWRAVHALDGDDTAARLRALQYLAGHALSDQRTIRSLVVRLHVEEDDRFAELAAGLDGAGLWRRDVVGDDPYLRRIGLRARSTSPEARISAAQALADLPDLADDPQLGQWLIELATDDDDEVRYNALVSLAMIAGTAARPEVYGDALDQLCDDEQTTIAEHARVIRNLLQNKPPPAPPVVPILQISREDLYAVLSSSDSPARDVACVLALDLLDESQLKQLVHELIVDLDDDGKMSGAILSGLTGYDQKLLFARESVEDVYTVRVVQRLGLWMGGWGVPIDPQALLLRGDLPRTTILLAMLFKGEYSALDELLNPRGVVPADLADLLVRRQWWRVAGRFLPQDAPQIDMTADPQEVDRQIEMLRDWCLVNRYRNMNKEPASE
ncbi:MAG: HEAT repeat domain-containing protein [Phycisphaeraceae bacterium]|nr:HEAT repeat domain-containing protein [Phycisphaeraceae bacterium]